MRKKLILASMLVSAQLICAQQSKDYTQADKLFHEGKALYDQGHFKAAYERLNEYFSTLNEKDRALRYIETEYYIACCTYEMQKRESGRKMEDFTSNNPQSTLANRIYFLSASQKYDRQLYKEAVEDFSKCDRLLLSQKESADYLFKQGYSLLQCKEIERARNTFSILLNQQSKYNVAAKYYKAYTDYLLKDYETALPVFEELQQVMEHGGVDRIMLDNFSVPDTKNWWYETGA